MRIIAIVLSFLSITSAFSQDLDTHIYRDLYKFKSMKKSVLKSKDTLDWSKCIRITNLADSINSKEFSIYKFEYANVDDSSEDILVIRAGHVDVFDACNINFIIEKVITYKMITPQLTDQLFFKIIRELIRLNERNKANGRETFMISKKFGNSVFYYDVSSLDSRRIK